MKIALGTDHAGFALRHAVLQMLSLKGHEVLDFGCFGSESCDYPDFARVVAEAVANGSADRGILMCGTGVGMSIAANKVPGVRAGVCWSDAVAALIAEHNAANVLCLPARFAPQADIIRWAEIWLATAFSAEPRHRQRIDKITSLERRSAGVAR